MPEPVAAERVCRATERFADVVNGVVGQQQLRAFQGAQMPVGERLRLLSALGTLSTQIPLDEWVPKQIAIPLGMEHRTVEQWLERVVVPALQLTKGLGELGTSLTPARNVVRSLQPQELRLGVVRPEDAPKKLGELPLETKVDIGSDEIRGDVGVRAQLSTAPARPVVAAVGLHSPAAFELPRFTSSLAFYGDDTQMVLRTALSPDPETRYAFRLGIASAKTHTEARLSAVLDHDGRPRVIDARLFQRFDLAALSFGFVDREGNGSLSGDVRLFLDESAPYSATVGLSFQHRLYGDEPVAPALRGEALLNVRLEAF